MMKPFFWIIPLLSVSLCLKAQVPTATIVPPATTLCTGNTYSFGTNTSNSPTAYSWTVFPSFSVNASPDKVSPSINLNFGLSGVYQLSLQVSNGTGSTVSSVSLNVNSTAHASFNASLTAPGFPTQMILTNYSTHTVTNIWCFSDAPNDTVANAVKDYTASGNYSIMLVAVGQNGCNDTSRYSFRIADSSGITMPDVFTPNNDSVNDVYRPIARGIKEMKAWIYDRYGTFIYSWDKPRGFWDGYTTSGNPCQAGIYYCVLEATGFDGKSYKLKTKILLVR